jgi:hypothetical protein
MHRTSYFAFLLFYVASTDAISQERVVTICPGCNDQLRPVIEPDWMPASKCRKASPIIAKPNSGADSVRLSAKNCPSIFPPIFINGAFSLRTILSGRFSALRAFSCRLRHPHWMYGIRYQVT